MATTKKTAPSKKAATKKQSETAPSKKVPKMEQLMISVDAISIRADFNPRKKLGDIDELTKSIRTHGVIAPITVRPVGDDTYEIIAGERRFTAAKAAKKKEIPCVVRNDLIDNDVEAFALAVAENSGDTRTQLAPLEQANAFKTLMESADGMTPAKVGRMCGYSGQHVRVMLRLLDAPIRIQQQLENGEISRMAAIAVADVPEEVRDRVADQVTSGTTEAEVKRMANAALREAYATEDDDTDDASTDDSNDDVTDTPRNAPAGHSTGVVIWRTKKEIRAKIELLAIDSLNAQEDGKKEEATASMNQLASLLWASGAIENTSIEAKEFKKSLAAIEAELEVVEAD